MDNNPNCPQLDDRHPPIQGPDVGLTIHLLYSLGPLLRHLVKLKILCIRIEYCLAVHYSMPIMKD